VYRRPLLRGSRAHYLLKSMWNTCFKLSMLFSPIINESCAKSYQSSSRPVTAWCCLFLLPTLDIIDFPPLKQLMYAPEMSRAVWLLDWQTPLSSLRIEEPAGLTCEIYERPTEIIIITKRLIAR
jgi:hypothetical protein